MHDLLSHFERELAELRTLTEDFASRYPQVAGRMAVSGELLQDPHVERLLQAFALLGARVRKRLDDDYSLFAESLLSLLHPQYLRPLPACAIACFVAAAAGDKPNGAAVLARGKELYAPLSENAKCFFRTTADAQLLPLRIASAGFRATATAPAGTAVPSKTAGILSLRLELLTSQSTWAALGVDTLRLYVDGERPLVAVLREALVSHVLATMVQTSDSGAWAVDARTLPRSLGFGDDEALIDTGPDTHSHPAHRLLTEYLAFPEKFNFVDLPLPPAVLRCEQRAVSLHFAIGSLSRASADMALLQQVTRDNLRIGCTPVINLFSLRTSPLKGAADGQGHPVQVDAARPYAHEVYAIDRVFRKHQGLEGTVTENIPPFISLGHGAQPLDDESSSVYWIEQRSAGDNPHAGFGTAILLVDIDRAPVDMEVKALSMDVRATNRDQPSRIEIGKPGGDLFAAEALGAWKEIRLLSRPTLSLRFQTDRGKLWRLISQLTPSQLLLRGTGIEALKEILSLHDLPRNAINRQIREGLVAIDCKPIGAFLEIDGFSSLVRGAEIRLTVDERNFVDVGLQLFAELIGRFFAIFVPANSFTQLKLMSSQTGAVLATGERRTGEQSLL